MLCSCSYCWHCFWTVFHNTYGFSNFVDLDLQTLVSEAYKHILLKPLCIPFASWKHVLGKTVFGILCQVALSQRKPVWCQTLRWTSFRAICWGAALPDNLASSFGNLLTNFLGYWVQAPPISLPWSAQQPHLEPSFAWAPFIHWELLCFTVVPLQNLGLYHA